MDSQSLKTKRNRPEICDLETGLRPNHQRVLPKGPYNRRVPLNREVKGGIVFLKNGKIVKKEDVK